MTPEAKTRHLNKIFNIKPVAALSIGVERLPTQSSIETQSKTKSIPSVRRSGPGLSVSWDQCKILMVPWTSNPKSHLVKSLSPQPHMVTTDPKDKCTDEMTSVRCTRDLVFCSQVIAAGEHNG